MPAYTYTGDEGRYYPTLGLTPDPGGEYELDRNPADGRWIPEDPEPAPEQEPEAEPVMEAMAEPDTGALEISGDGSGTALPAVEAADPGPHTAPARTRAPRKTKEA